MRMYIPALMRMYSVSSSTLRVLSEEFQQSHLIGEELEFKQGWLERSLRVLFMFEPYEKLKTI